MFGIRKNLIFTCSFILVSLIGCKMSKRALPEDTAPAALEDTIFDWYKIQKLNDYTYSIAEPRSSQDNVSYLIVGTDKAIMFDTGSGENKAINGLKISPIIDMLTDLPVTLLQSHFHFDHNQNIKEFTKVGFPAIPFLQDRVGSDGIFRFTKRELFLGDFPSTIRVDQWFSIDTNIDLGNRIIQLINIPGHTPESIAIIDKTNKMAFLGDYLYNGSLYIFDPDDIVIYKESVNLLLKLLDKDYKLYGAHDSSQIPYADLGLLHTFLTCIENNECQSSSTQIFGHDVLAYEYDHLKIMLFE